MRERARWRTASAVIFILIPLTGVILAGGQRQQQQRRSAITASDCTYLENPTRFRFKAEDGFADRTATTSKVAATFTRRTPSSRSARAILR